MKSFLLVPEFMTSFNSWHLLSVYAGHLLNLLHTPCCLIPPMIPMRYLPLLSLLQWRGNCGFKGFSKLFIFSWLLSDFTRLKVYVSLILKLLPHPILWAEKNTLYHENYKLDTHPPFLSSPHPTKISLSFPESHWRFWQHFQHPQRMCILNDKLLACCFNIQSLL